MSIYFISNTELSSRVIRYLSKRGGPVYNTERLFETIKSLIKMIKRITSL